MEILWSRLPEEVTRVRFESVSSTSPWATGGVRVACGYGCVARVVVRHKKCRMMFNSNDFSLIQGWGYHCLVTIWIRHWTYFEWNKI